MDKPVKQSNYTDMGTKSREVENHTKMVDKDLQNLFQYVGKLPQTSGALANINSHKLLGRYSSGLGQPEEIVIGSNLSLTGNILSSTGGSGSPGGSDTCVQYNDGGTSFGGDLGLTWGKNTGILSVQTQISFLPDSQDLNGAIICLNQTTVDTGGNSLYFQSANGNGTGDGGGIAFQSGNAGLTSGKAGGVNFTIGYSYGNSDGGGFTVYAGNASGNGTGGDIVHYAGSGNPDGNGGSIQNYAGDGGGASGDGGSIQNYAGGGSRSVASTGGSIFDYAGGGLAYGGGLFFYAGRGGVLGGSVWLYAGNGDDPLNPNGDGGDVKVYPGTPGGYANNAGNFLVNLSISYGASSGKFKVLPLGGSIAGILDFDSITTSDKTFSFPNASGTIALQGLAGTKVYYVSDSSGGAVTRKLTFTNGILTAET